ncbi:MAG: hypothetical protein HY901_30645 [Deltaproteobacteria bacterium]|nr:hypothetical protein [Deltaproteobacteria bacterium]
MGFKDWVRRLLGRPSPPEDPLAVFDRRLATMASRGSDLRRAAATLLAARAEVDRALEAARAQVQAASARLQSEQGRPEIAEVLAHDRTLASDREQALEAQRSTIAADAEGLTEVIKRLESEAELLRRERTAAAAQLAAGRALSASAVIAEDPREVLALERAREDVERAHALAQICREDLARRGR